MKTTTRTGANHPLHLVLTLITCGMWAPFWMGAAIIGRRTTVRTQMPAPYWPPNAAPPQPPVQWPAQPTHNPYREGPR